MLCIIYALLHLLRDIAVFAIGMLFWLQSEGFSSYFGPITICAFLRKILFAHE